MANIFNVQSELHENPNRNNFDGTHKRHMTGKFGYIYPFLCQPVVPTDTWEIETAIGVNLMPMWYPTQSNMRFMCYYFYIPNRIIMKDWKNFSEGFTDAELPYLDWPAAWYETGSLADYLGVPTNLVLSEDTDFTLSQLPSRISWAAYGNTVNIASQLSSVNVGRSFDFFFPAEVENSTRKIVSGVNTSMSFLILQPFKPLASNVIFLGDGEGFIASEADSLSVCLAFFGSSVPFQRGNVQDLKFLGSHCHQVVPKLSPLTSFTLDGEEMNYVNGYLSENLYVYCAVVLYLSGVETTVYYYDESASANLPTEFKVKYSIGSNIDIASYENYSPYYSTGHTTDTVKVRSLAFRCYEMVYNSYFRDSHGVQPFVVNNEVQYNNYLTTDASGADVTHYQLQTRNWELDAYTSCLPSPQQGNAPVIAVNVDGRMRIAHDDGTTSTVQLRDLNGAAGVEVINSEIDPEHPEDARTILSLATSGMTIADFRYGNALTRFLEQSLRSGFRYADFIFGQFGAAPKHQELDMPIFLGGYTQLVDTSKVTNVSDMSSLSPDAAKLGQFAGVGASFDAQKHKIKHYFDDFGYVLGVMCLVPDAAYSQILPKHFSYSSRLDYYYPQFGQLGLQPITYEEICPIQSHAEYVNGDTSKLLTDTFGYQRPNHDLVWFPDTVHGLFRTSLSGSVIQRRFGSRPELSDEFMRISPKECNDIFSVTELGDDTWIGQVVCKITMQRPVPRVVVPSLGR